MEHRNDYTDWPEPLAEALAKSNLSPAQTSWETDTASRNGSNPNAEGSQRVRSKNPEKTGTYIRKQQPINLLRYISRTYSHSVRVRVYEGQGVQ